MSPTYVLENGLRFVKPYYLTHQVTTKKRWVGRTVLDVFTKEFRDFGEEAYKSKILDNKIQVHRKFKGKRDRQVLSGEDLFILPLKDGDIVVNTSHKHEPVVTASPISIIFEDESVVVIDKPSGIPIHPVQKYFHNTVTEIMKDELKFGKLFVCHRLDKLTSGVLILAKNFKAANRIQEQIRERKVQKQYLARVIGQLPAPKKGDSEIICDDDILVIDSKRKIDHGLSQQEAVTKFKVVRYNEKLNQSIVLCTPLTGRTHQIRIHLRNLGNPIVNDPMYGPGGLYEKVVTDVDQRTFESFEDNARTRREAMETGETCQECGTKLYKDPLFENLILWLHAKSYKSMDEKNDRWEYATEEPAWTNI